MTDQPLLLAEIERSDNHRLFVRFTFSSKERLPLMAGVLQLRPEEWDGIKRALSTEFKIETETVKRFDDFRFIEKKKRRPKNGQIEAHPTGPDSSVDRPSADRGSGVGLSESGSDPLSETTGSEAGEEDRQEDATDYSSIADYNDLSE